MKSYRIFLTIALSLGALSASSQAAPLTAEQKDKARKVTSKLTELLHKRIKSPGGTLQIRVVPAARADQGYFKEIFIDAKPARIKKLYFSALTLRALNVRISPTALMNDRKITTISSQTTMRAVVTEEEVTQALAKGRESADKGLKVKFEGDRIRVTGRWQMSWFSGPMEAVGRLKLGSGHTVVADIETLKLNGANVPMAVKNKFSEKINPLIDYNSLPFRPPFKTLRFSGAKAIISA
jgi:hypothetical protein